MWIALTLRQTCLFVVAGLTLLHVRMGRPVSFGAKHWILAVPTGLLVFASTGVAGTLAGADTTTFFLGMVSYSAALAVFSSVAFGCLIGTLLLIRRNLARLDAASEPWPPAAPLVEEKNRPAFANEDIEHLKDGASWITSVAGSRRESLVSAFSYTTRHTRQASLTSSLRHQLAENSSRQIKPSAWFPSATPPPPVPPLPATYRSRTPTSAYLNDEVDPFARAPTPNEGHPQRQRPIGSQTSWLTSESGSQTTLTAWSYPTAAPRPGTPAMSDDSHHDLPERDPQATLRPSSAMSRAISPALSAQVLGGYGFAAEKKPTLEKINVSTSTEGTEVDVSVYRAIGWLVTIWVPLGLSLPYLLMTTASATFAPQWASILLVLSVTLSSPILAFNILFRSPLPIPSDLFDSFSEPPSVVHRAPSPASSGVSCEYKRSASVTIVEGRRSGDVWLANGDAVDAKSKVDRMRNMISTKPKLSIMPPAPYKLDGELTPPIPFNAEEPGQLPPTPTTATTETGKFEQERKRKESKASSYYSGTTDAVQHASRIMIAQRHYSTVATTVVVPPSPDQAAGRKSTDTTGSAVATGVLAKEETPQHNGHLRTRSVSSMSGRASPISPPPPTPLPPTPPTLKNARAAQLLHRRAHSSDVDFSFGAIEADNTREIDALSARMLPILMPGIEVGRNVRITDFAPMATPSSTSGKSKKRLSNLRNSMASIEFGSPEGASTPKKGRMSSLKRNSSGHRRDRFSLPR
jgi:hypothetical protein